MPFFGSNTHAQAMFEDDATYYRRRAEVELEQAQRATLPEVVHAHYEMANAYLERLVIKKPAHPVRDA